MQYLLLIYESEANRQSVDRPKMMEDYGKFTRSIIESGNFKAGDALAADLDGNDRSRQGRKDGDHPRPVCRDP